VLVLCGYISEISKGPAVLEQEAAAGFLRERLEESTSPQALKALLSRLHGSFSVFFRDFQKGASLCLTDRMASRPIWRRWSGEGWIVSTHPLAITALTPFAQVDPGALGALLLYGGPIHPLKSLFAEVEAVPPGSIVELQPDGSAKRSIWYRFRHEADTGYSMADLVELAAERMVQSASRIARQCDRPVLFLSGGVDSRLTAAALKAAGAKPLLVTLGDARNLEVKVSQQAAEALGLEHRVILRDKHWYLRSLPGLIPETGGSLLWIHGHFSQAALQMRKEGFGSVFMLGDFCEALSKLFCSLPPDRKRPWTAQEFVSEFDRSRLPQYRAENPARTLSLLKPKARDDVKQAMSEDILDLYQQVAEVSADPWIVADHCFRWWGASTLPTFFMFQDLRSVAAERNLMFDPDVHSLLERLPARLRNGANLGARLIRKLDAPASRVANSNSLLPMCWPPMAHKFSKKCKPVLGRMRRLLLGRTHRTTGAWPEKSALYGTDPEWREFIGEVIEGEKSWGEMLDRDRVRECWQAVLNGSRELAPDLEKVIQLGMLSRSKQHRLVAT
jgi:hypothetical protein